MSNKIDLILRSNRWDFITMYYKIIESHLLLNLHKIYLKFFTLNGRINSKLDKE